MPTPDTQENSPRTSGVVSKAFRKLGSGIRKLANSRATMYTGLGMMALGAAMSLTGIGAIAGGPLLLAGSVVAGGSFLARRHTAKEAMTRQQAPQPPRQTIQYSGPEQHIDDRLQNLSEVLADVSATLGVAPPTLEAAQQRSHLSSTTALGDDTLSRAPSIQRGTSPLERPGGDPPAHSPARTTVIYVLKQPNAPTPPPRERQPSNESVTWPDRRASTALEASTEDATSRYRRDATSPIQGSQNDQGLLTRAGRSVLEYYQPKKTAVSRNSSGASDGAATPRSVASRPSTSQTEQRFSR